MNKCGILYLFNLMMQKKFFIADAILMTWQPYTPLLKPTQTPNTNVLDNLDFHWKRFAKMVRVELRN